MKKWEEVAKKFGIYRKNGISERLKQAQLRVEFAENMTIEAVNKLRQRRGKCQKQDECKSGELIPAINRR